MIGLTPAHRRQARDSVVRVFPDGAAGLRQAAAVATARGRGQVLATRLQRAVKLAEVVEVTSLTMGGRHQRADILCDRAKARLMEELMLLIPAWESEL